MALFRTALALHRTALAMFRTALAVFRTALAAFRTLAALQEQEKALPSTALPMRSAQAVAAVQIVAQEKFIRKYGTPGLMLHTVH